MTSPDDTIEARIRRLIAVCQDALRGGMPGNLQALFLYGSALGPAFRSDSDIDIAVLDHPDNRLSWKEQARLMDLFERATGHSVDLRMLRDNPLSYQVNVLERGKRFWVGDSAEADRYERDVRSSWSREAHQEDRAWSEALSRLSAL
jgi:predicted nucleotidyltransferase